MLFESNELPPSFASVVCALCYVNWAAPSLFFQSPCPSWLLEGRAVCSPVALDRSAVGLTQNPLGLFLAGRSSHASGEPAPACVSF